MALADFAAFKAALSQFAFPPNAALPPASVSHTQLLAPYWRECIFDAAPGAAAVPAQSAGLNQVDAGSGRLTIMGLEASLSEGTAGGADAYPGWVLIYDRLSHQSGLSATVTTPQTTNLPTAALPRYTSGVGVMAAYQVYTAIGTTVTTVGMSYTNQAGTAGRTAALSYLGGTTGTPPRDTTVFVPLAALANGDTGIKSVESVTVTGTTGTAGDFGITLFKPLALIPIGYGYTADMMSGLIGGLEEVLDGACLSMAVQLNGAGSLSGAVTSPVFAPWVHFAEL